MCSSWIISKRIKKQPSLWRRVFIECLFRLLARNAYGRTIGSFRGNSHCGEPDAKAKYDNWYKTSGLAHRVVGQRPGYKHIRTKELLARNSIANAIISMCAKSWVHRQSYPPNGVSLNGKSRVCAPRCERTSLKSFIARESRSKVSSQQ